MGIKYSDFVEYEKLDPFKRMALEIFEPTFGYPKRLGIELEPRSVGLTASVFKIPAGKEFLISINPEGLGTKNEISDEMWAFVRTFKKGLRIFLPGTHFEFDESRFYRHLGQDTVAMSVNDLSAMGADPFAYVDIVSTGHSDWVTDMNRARQLLLGYRDAADIGQFAIPAGETPTLKGIVYPDTVDLNGFSVGVVKKPIYGDEIVEGDGVFCFTSPGINANGLTKARAIGEKLPDGFFTKLENSNFLGEELLTPTPIYAFLVSKMLDKEHNVDVHGLQPITGHGVEKIARYKREFTYRIKELPEPPLIFRKLIEWGKQYGFDVTDRENHYTWNMGIGYIVIAPKSEEEKIKKIAKEYPGPTKIEALYLGDVEKGPRRVVMPFEENGKPAVYVP